MTPRNICAGIPLDPNREEHGICRCCGESMPIVHDDGEMNMTPGGFCWACSFGEGGECCHPTWDWGYDPNHDAFDEDLSRAIGSECPECGARGACSWDAEGLPLMHATRYEEAS